MPDRRPGLRPLRTVRSKITLLATALVAAMLAASGVGLVVAQRQVLTHGVDEALRQRVDNMQQELARPGTPARLPGEGDPEDSFIQLVAEDGTVLGSSKNVAGMPAASRPIQPESGDRFTTVEAIPISDHPFRVMARGLGDAVEARTVVVGKNLDDVNESVGILATLLGLSIPVVTSLLALLVWWLTGRVLRPVETIRAQVATIQGTDLHRRIPTPASDDEISRLAHTMNAMLARVEQAAERQRRFVADASHELRTPLTRIRSSLEVSLAHPGTLDPTVLHRSLLADTTDLERLVDDLLFLARSESGALEAVSEAVDLDDLVLDEARRLRHRGVVEVDTSRVSAARTTGDARQLARAIRNLASNAERHATSRVAFGLAEHDVHSELVVADDGPGIAPEHRAFVFERFARLDEARSRDAGGAGLGLAIVRDIVIRHGGSVAIEAEDGGGALFVLTLPRAV